MIDAVRRTINAMEPIRAAFVMEQTLGHVTHAQNLRNALAAQGDIVPTWLPVPFPVSGPGRVLPVWRSNWSVRASWRARRALDAALASDAHDAVFIHTQVASLFSVGVMQRIPTVVSLDATPFNFDVVGRYYGHRPAGDGPLDRQKFALNRKVFHAAAALVAWSNWAKQSLVEDYGVDGAQVRVLAPGAAPAFFDLGRQRLVRMDGSANDGQDGLVRLLFVGGDFKRKGGPLLLQCMLNGLDERCELHLVTQEAVAPQRNVFVHNNVGPNSDALRRLFAMADVFVLPTNAECLAVVLMEATAAGLPVITTDVGALGEAVVPGETGMLVAPGDTVALRGALERLVEDAALRSQMGRAGHALAEKKFDARANNRALLDLLTEVSHVGSDRRKVA